MFVMYRCHLDIVYYWGILSFTLSQSCRLKMWRRKNFWIQDGLLDVTNVTNNYKYVLIFKNSTVKTLKIV
jgi:hypothetical protein